MVNARNIIRRTISLVFWLTTLTVVLMSVFIIFRLFSPTMPSKTMGRNANGILSTKDTVYRLAWEEPFEYEISVYASADHGYIQNHTRFFDNAQLLWHIPAQSISNSYPLFKHTTTVDIPEQILDDENHNTTLYVHAFIQSAGQAAPYPNISDSQLIHFQTELVWWANPRHYREPPSMFSKPPQELLSATTLPWAMVLEDRKFSEQHLPMHLSYNVFDSHNPWFKRDPTYLPLFRINQYTRNPIDFMPTVLLTSDETEKHAKTLTVNVDFEIQGIRHLWVMIKDAALALSNPGRDYMYNSLDLTDLVIAEGYIDDPSLYQSLQIYRPLTLVERNSVYTLLSGGVVIVLFVVCVLIMAKVTAEFWSGPKDNFIGVSRVMVAISTFDCALRLLYPYLDGAGIFSSDGIMSLIGVCGMLFALFNPWSTSTFADSRDNTQTSVPFEDNPSPAETHQPLQTNIEDETYFMTKRAKQIIKARKQVDNAAVYWLKRLVVPILAATAIFAGYSNSWKWTELDFVLGLIAALIHLTFWLQWLPQVLVNFQAKDGSLYPVTILICGLFQYLLGGFFNYLTTSDDIFEQVSYAGLVEHAWQAVIIVQWIFTTAKYGSFNFAGKRKQK